MVGIVKNEALTIFEWLVYHGKLGFDHIIIYDNGSEDDTKTEIAKAARHVSVAVIDWPERPGQLTAYNHAIVKYGSQFDFMAFFDADEFLVPMDTDWQTWLANLPPADHLGVFWLIFGSNGHVQRPTGLVTRNYTRRAEESRGTNLHLKSIVRSKKIASESRFVNPHWMNHSSYAALDGKILEWFFKANKIHPGQPIDGGKAVSNTGYDVARLNHYYCKSREEYDFKLSRRRATSLRPKINRFEKNDRNEVEDRTIQLLYGDILAEIEALIAAENPATGYVDESSHIAGDQGVRTESA